MQSTTHGGRGVRQNTNNGAANQGSAVQSPGGPPNPGRLAAAERIGGLLTELDYRRALGGISERKFKALRAAGLVGDPLNLGPRTARWVWADVETTIAALPRRAPQPEPATLASGRRRKIEAAKAGVAR